MQFKIGAIALCVLAATGLAQSRPDVSGDWVLDKQRSTQTMRGRGVTSVTGLLGEKFTARQNEKTLTFDISVAALQRTVTAVYNLDGSESRNLNPTGPGLPDEPIFSKVSWEGSRLVIHTRGTAQGTTPPLETKRVIWIDADGLLTIERTAEGQTTTRSVYRRAQPGTRDYLPTLL